MSFLIVLVPGNERYGGSTKGIWTAACTIAEH